jgi:hypothetical protein
MAFVAVSRKKYTPAVSPVIFVDREFGLLIFPPEGPEVFVQRVLVIAELGSLAVPLAITEFVGRVMVGLLTFAVTTGAGFTVSVYEVEVPHSELESWAAHCTV